jgi:hypothetical protein
MNNKKKAELLAELQPEYKGTNIEHIYLSAAEEGFVPGWILAAKPVEQVARERAWLLAEESRKRKAAERRLSEVLSERSERRESV